MVNYEKIERFINYNYIPFSVSQCIKRLVGIWGLSMAVCLIGERHPLWFIILGTFDVLISITFFRLICKMKTSKSARFLCDGVFYLYIALVLDFAAYRVMALNFGESWILFLVFLLLLLVCITIVVFIVFLNIKSDKYKTEKSTKKFYLLPFLGGTCGILFARLFLKSLSQGAAITLLAVILLTLSLMMSIGSVNLLKFVWSVNNRRQRDGSPVS
ncbi:MAG: hypothetical protein IJM97_04005 [Clostridia bacterium]|nr:hypothetical protein [Clostridia bacterium]